MMVHRWLALATLLLASVEAIYEEQAGQNDWHKVLHSSIYSANGLPFLQEPEQSAKLSDATGVHLTATLFPYRRTSARSRTQSLPSEAGNGCL